jgi:serine/threonine-protein kinase
VRQLGRGGMGEVYLGQHPRLPRRDALKVLRTEISSDDSFRQRFIRESDSIAALDHPHIVTVYDRGDTEGRLWIATQYVDGADASQLLRDRYPAGMPVDEAVAITAAVAEALDHAHDRGLIHRDVKPANILLAQPDQDGTRRIYLADFGIARPLDDAAGLTSTNFTLGTFAYAAPEQLMGKAIDGRADQYALAATTYHLLTGTPVFSDSNQIAVISQHLTQPASAPSTMRPELAPFDAAFAKALAKNPHDRYRNCRDFAKALTDAAGSSGGDYPVSARTLLAPIPAIRPAASTRRRSSVRGMLAAAVTLALIAGAALLWHPWTQQDKAAAPTPPTTAAPSATTTPVRSSTPLPAPSTTPSPATTSSSPPPPPPSSAPANLSGATAAPTVAASSIAVVGSGCNSQSSPTVDSDGVPVYCAQFPSTDAFIWTREVVQFPCGPRTCVGVQTTLFGLDADTGVSICVTQTGWAPSACAYAVATATYRGDGPRPICTGLSAACNPGRS